jgi:hypothetical protein
MRAADNRRSSHNNIQVECVCRGGRRPAECARMRAADNRQAVITTSKVQVECDLPWRQAAGGVCAPMRAATEIRNEVQSTADGWPSAMWREEEAEYVLFVG